MTTDSTTTGRQGLVSWPARGWAAILVTILVLGSLTILAWYRTAAAPAVGEPFDVRAFLSITVPDDQNAFVFYRQAKHRYVAVSGSNQEEFQKFWKSENEAIDTGWAKANEQVRNWLVANQPALELWKRGTECADAQEIPFGVLDDTDILPLPVSRWLPEFARLGLLQAARATAEKHPDDAWIWYRAVLRSSRHVGRHVNMIGPFFGIELYRMCVEPILRWSSRPELTASQLRHALADVLEIDAMTAPSSDTLKTEYVENCESLKFNFTGFSNLLSRFMGYPARTKQGLNLVYANWLSQVDRPRFRRLVSKETKWGLFELDPAMPPSPNVLSPAEIESRCDLGGESPPAVLLGQMTSSVSGFIQAKDRERTRQAALVLGLALELYHREHGQFPAALDELVKQRYLESIPADPFGKGEAFHYRRDAAPRQGAMLWSVWTDGIDQNGKVDVDQQPEAASGDKIFRIASPQ